MPSKFECLRRAHLRLIARWQVIVDRRRQSGSALESAARNWKPCLLRPNCRRRGPLEHDLPIRRHPPKARVATHEDEGVPQRRSSADLYVLLQGCRCRPTTRMEGAECREPACPVVRRGTLKRSYVEARKRRVGCASRGAGAGPQVFDRPKRVKTGRLTPLPPPEVHDE